MEAMSRGRARSNDESGFRLEKRALGGWWRLSLGELIGRTDCPLMRRWVVETPLGSLRLHHFLRSDYDRDFHDHPWWFATLVLAGGYEDHSPHGVDRLRRGSLRLRPTNHRHRVETDGCWTLIATGPYRRGWGFWRGELFTPMRDYFARYGYAACEEPGREDDRLVGLKGDEYP